jgi:hypothetical protein
MDRERSISQSARTGNGERSSRGAAEVRQAFQHQHALTFPGERCASGEPAEARPDDDCIPRSAVIGHRSLSFMAVTSAAPRRGDPHPAQAPLGLPQALIALARRDDHPAGAEL